jgi:putative PEP-CTERM system histidine kinase
MEVLLAQIAFGGHALAALLFAALAIWQWQRMPERSWVAVSLVFAVGFTAFWSLAILVEGAASPAAGFAETLRNMAWLFFMYRLLMASKAKDYPATIRFIYVALVFVLLGQWPVDALVPALALIPELQPIALLSALLLRMIFAVGALVLIHNLYTISAVELRWGLRLPMAALAAMWTYDLNLYTIHYITQSLPTELSVMRGVAMAMLGPVFFLGFLRNSDWKFRLSRSVTFHSLSLMAISFYLTLVAVVATVLQFLGGDYAMLAQISFLFGTGVAALLLLPSGRFRAWLKVKVVKNFFQHRYDYRVEWLRFTDTIGRPGDTSDTVHVRVIKAVADITESTAGLLLMPNDGNRLVLQAHWNWRSFSSEGPLSTARTIDFFTETGHIVEVQAVREGRDDRLDPAALPDRLIDDAQVWAIVPLVHFERLTGLIVLARPRVSRTLDWEDFDMLRVVGRQVASYLAEASSQEALSEAARFDEFNRRMAFIMHDIKNLVSQLSLVARNAERHADNPEFRADMVATLQDSVTKMNNLLSRLSQHNKGKADEPAAMALRPLLERIAHGPVRPNQVALRMAQDIHVIADPVRIEQILEHLLANACDASPADSMVTIVAEQRDGAAAIDVIDSGCGMSGEFIRSQLFKPFASTKAGGFGIGAYEARALARSMKGEIDVESTPGSGSRFTLRLPLASAAPIARTRANLNERVA